MNLSALVCVVGLVVVAVCSWPAGDGLRRRDSRHEKAGVARPVSAGAVPSTVEDVADAVVLLAVALKGGAAVTTALDRVADLTTGQVSDDLRTVAAAHRWGLGSAAAWHLLDPCWQPVALVWEAAERAGVAPAALLESVASRLRERESAVREARVQRAGVLLVLPLGGLFLPGFLATTVVPVVLHLLAQAGR